MISIEGRKGASKAAQDMEPRREVRMGRRDRRPDETEKEGPKQP